MEGRCGSCKWWEPKEETYQIREGWGNCTLTHLDGGTRPTHPESLAIAEDAESYMAWLATSPEFGCVQWEKHDS